MLTSFEERERAAETIYIYGEEMRSVNHIAGIRALVAFAREMLGLDGETSEAYARSLIAGRIDGLRPDALLNHAGENLVASGVDVPLADLEAESAQVFAQRRFADGQRLDLTPAHRSRFPKERRRMTSSITEAMP